MYKVIKKENQENVTRIAAVTAKGKILLPDEDGNYLFVNSDSYEVKEYPIPSKEQFCKMIAEIKDIDDRHEKLNDVLSKVCLDSILIFPTLKDSILEYLSLVFNDTSNWIYYYVCDLNYGKDWHLGCVTFNNDDYKLETPEELYDLLIESILTL